MFKRIGELITGKPLVFIAIWAIILIIFGGLGTNLGSHLVYDVSSFTSNSSEPKQADNLAKAVFPDAAKSQLVVIVRSDNETTGQAFITELNRTVMNDTAIRNVTNTTSVYDVQRTILEKMTPDIYDGLFDGMDNASDVNHKLYNATDDVRNNSHQIYWLWDNVTATNDEFNHANKKIVDSSGQLYSARDQIVQGNGGLYQIHGAFDLIDGGTLTYAQAFGAAFNGTNLDDACTAAYGATMSRVVGPISDPSQKQLAGAWVATLNGTWRSEPTSSMGKIMQDAGSSFMSTAGGSMPPQQRQTFQGVIGLGDKGLNDYRNADQSALKQDIIGMAMQAQGLTSDADRARLSAIYDLGPSPSAAAIEDLVVGMAASQSGTDQGSIREIYDLGRSPSYGTIGNYLVDKAVTRLKDSDEGKNMSASDLQNATDMIHEAWDIGRTPTKQDFDSYVLKTAEKGLNDSQKQDLRKIWGWGPNPNDSVVRSFVLIKAGDGHNASDNQSIAEIYDLGRNASNATLQDYVVRKATDKVNVTGNLSYFYWIMEPGRNLTDDQLQAMADSWTDAHGFDNPQVLPGSVTKLIESGNSMLYVVGLSDDESSASATGSAQRLMDDVNAQLKEEKYKGVEAQVTGMPAMIQDLMTTATKDVESIDAISIPLVILILGVFFMAIVAPFVPMAAIGVAIATGMGALYLVTFAVGDIYNLAQTFLIVTMLGAGIDYCVFILSRYKEERELGGSVRESVIYAMEHAGESIACSGVCAAIGFGSLTLIDHGIFMSIGISTALGIFVAMCAALTLVPAVITLAGDRIFWPRKISRAGSAKSRLGPHIRRITKFALGHWKALLLVLAVALVPMAYVALQMSLGQDTISMLPGDAESKAGYDTLNSVFGSGNIDKTTIVVTLPRDIKDGNGNYSTEALDRVEEISRIAASEPNVDSVYSLTRPYGSAIRYDNLSVYNALDKKIYETYMDNNTGVDNRTTIVYVSMKGSPYSSEAFDTITDLRSKLNAYGADNGAGARILVGGSAAAMQNYQDSCTPRYGIVILTVFVGIFLVLMYLLRSLLTPPRLFLAMISMVAVTLGVFTLVFQYWMHETIFWVLPVSLFCILFGLGGDYVIFMMSRVREEVDKGKSDEDAILDAIESTGPIILLCGAVMATAFASMMSSGMVIMKEFGFVLSFGIILDATVMIWVVIPILMMAFKKYNWWMPGITRKIEVKAAEPLVKKD